MEVVVSARHFAELHQGLLARAPSESAAFLAVRWSGSRGYVRSFHVFSDHDLNSGGFGELTIDEAAQVRELAAIKRAGLGAVEVHTHPGSNEHVGFSVYDEEQLPDFARYVQRKMPGRPFAAFVFGRRSYEGRVWTKDGQQPLHLRVVGQALDIPEWLSGTGSALVEPRYDRQIRALGADGQRRLGSLRVGVVGLGGTGGQVVQQLAHLGVRTFVLVDDDVVEHTNLPRLAGATWWDPLLRRKKTWIASRTIRRIARRALVRRIGNLRTEEALQSLRRVDVIIGCVDNDGARLILSELTAAYLIPYLDLGVGVEDRADEHSMGGRVSFYLPGGPCLACADELDFQEAAEDLESEHLRNIRMERGYARDRRIEPALMPLNGVIVSEGLLELLAFATGFRRVLPFTRHDALTGQVRRSNVETDPECPVCLPAYAMGNRQHMDRYAIGRAVGSRTA